MEKVESDQYDLIVLDEITYLPLYDFLDVNRIIDLIKSKPERLSIIITGRDASSQLIEMADTVTVMEPVKHAYENGVLAQKGIEF